MERRLSFKGSPVLGVFATCTEELVILPPDLEEVAGLVEEALGVTSVQTRVDGGSVIGCLVRGNCHGFVVSRNILKRELSLIQKHAKVARLSGEMNAAGNLILANDSAALVHPNFPDKAIRIVEKTLGVKVYKGTIGGLKTVGMSGVATNKGVLVHPRASESEIARLEEIFSLPVDIGTVNFGSPLVGSALLANSKGYVVGADTTGPELSRIEDALGYL